MQKPVLSDVVLVRCSAQMRADLERLSAGRSVAAIAREAIEAYLARQQAGADKISKDINPARA